MKGLENKWETNLENPPHRLRRAVKGNNKLFFQRIYQAADINRFGTMCRIDSKKAREILDEVGLLTKILAVYSKIGDKKLKIPDGTPNGALKVAFCILLRKWKCCS